MGKIGGNTEGVLWVVFFSSSATIKALFVFIFESERLEIKKYYKDITKNSVLILGLGIDYFLFWTNAIFKELKI